MSKIRESDGTIRDLTPEEIAAREAENQQVLADAQAIKDAIAARRTTVAAGIGQNPGNSIPDLNERIRKLEVAVEGLAKHVGLLSAEERQ